MRSKLSTILATPIENFRSNIRGFKTDGIGITILLLLIIVILGANIYRVADNAQKNYNVYVYEKDTLAELHANYEGLEQEYTFITSDEAKLLLARDMLSLGKPEEELFETKDDPKFYQVEVQLLDISEKDNYKNWWLKLGRDSVL